MPKEKRKIFQNQNDRSVTYSVEMASLMHKDSCESINKELDLFSVPLTQISLEKRQLC